MAQEMEFPCTGCGICCTRVWMVKGNLTKEEFPYELKDDGSCEKLGPDNKCEVYEDRPDICSIDRTFENKHSETMTRKEAYKMNAKLCNQWMKEKGIEDRIDMSVFE